MNYIYKRLRPCYEGICVGWFYDCRKANAAKNDHEGTMQEHMNGQGVYNVWQANVDCSALVSG